MKISIKNFIFLSLVTLHSLSYSMLRRSLFFQTSGRITKPIQRSVAMPGMDMLVHYQARVEVDNDGSQVDFSDLPIPRIKNIKRTFQRRYSDYFSFLLAGCTATCLYTYDRYRAHIQAKEEKNRKFIQQVTDEIKETSLCERLEVVSLFDRCKQELGIKQDIELCEGKQDTCYQDVMACYDPSTKRIWLSTDFFELSKTRQRMTLLHELRHWQQYNILTDREKQSVVHTYKRQVPWLQRANDVISGANEYDADLCAVKHTKCFYCLLSFMFYRNTLNKGSGYMQLYDIVPFLEQAHKNCSDHASLSCKEAFDQALKLDDQVTIDKWNKLQQARNSQLSELIQQGRTQEAQHEVLQICEAWSESQAICAEDIEKVL